MNTCDEANEYFMSNLKIKNEVGNRKVEMYRWFYEETTYDSKEILNCLTTSKGQNLQQK